MDFNQILEFIFLLTSQLVNYIVSEVVMDETFHSQQCAEYFLGNFSKWNPKITTPPGLYIYFLCFYWVFFKNIFQFDLNIQRFFVSTHALLIFKQSCKIFMSQKANQHIQKALFICLCPAIFLCYFLFYTDAPSLFLLLLSYQYSLQINDHRSIVISAACSLGSLFFRQTNIIWAGFIFVSIFEKSLLQSKFYWGNFLAISISFGTIFGLFLLFILWNGKQIVLGDHTAHKPRFNIFQFFLFFVFAGALNWNLMRLPPQFTCEWKMLAICCFFGGAAAFFGDLKFHEYNLVDNGHYISWMCIRLQSHQQLVKYFLGFLYAVPATNVWNTLEMPIVTKCFFFLCALASTSFSSLIEFRYFTVPLVFYTLHASSKMFGWCAVCWIAAIDLGMLTAFLKGSRNKRYLW